MKKKTLLVGFCFACLIGLVLWFVLRDSTKPELGAFSKIWSKQTKSANQTDLSQTTATAPPKSKVQSFATSPRSGATESLANHGAPPSKALSQLTLPELIAQNTVESLEYAIGRLEADCRGVFALPPEKAAYFKDQIQAISPPQSLVGQATAAQRFAAYTRGYNQCAQRYFSHNINFKDLAKLVRGTDGVMSRLEQAKEHGVPTNDYTREEIREIWAVAMEQRGLGAVGGPVLANYQLGPLRDAYPEASNNTLRELHKALVLCRMGENCDGGSLLSDRVCARIGYCGKSVEEAIRASFLHENLDFAPFDAFLRRTFEIMDNPRKLLPPAVPKK